MKMKSNRVVSGLAGVESELPCHLCFLDEVDLSTTFRRKRWVQVDK